MNLMAEKYYLVETEWVGPDPDEHVLEHTFTITTEQPLTNLGRQPLDKPGWLGTTNDWDERYHGMFSRREDAILHMHKHYPRAVESDEDEDEFLVHPEESTSDIDDWIDGGCDDVDADTTDEEIKEIARKIEADANEQGVYITDDVEDWLLAYRATIMAGKEEENEAENDPEEQDKKTEEENEFARSLDEEE
jgi:hypothetical protein